MKQRRNLKQLIMGVFKDKASIIKATLSTKRTVSSIRVAVIRATTHKRNTPPSNHRVSAILSLGNRSFLLQSVCIDAILHRLHKTSNPYVALKCLILIHNFILKGFSIFKNQLNLHPLAEGQNSLNLSSFQNDEDEECFELSSWVRWYASVVECSIITSRFLCKNIYNNDDYYGKEYLKVDTILVKEINILVSFVEEICEVPDSLMSQKIDVVHDAMMLVGKGYRSTQLQIAHRLGELDGRVNRLSARDSAELVSCLGRLEGCRGRLSQMFRNRMKNVDFWKLVRLRKIEVLDNGNKLLLWLDE